MRDARSFWQAWLAVSLGCLFSCFLLFMAEKLLACCWWAEVCVYAALVLLLYLLFGVRWRRPRDPRLFWSLSVTLTFWLAVTLVSGWRSPRIGAKTACATCGTLWVASMLYAYLVAGRHWRVKKT